jgi:hypothetical protein
VGGKHIKMEIKETQGGEIRGGKERGKERMKDVLWK